jgi:exosortase/archaeosortase family protein
MLWHSCIAAMALSAFHRCSWPVTIAAGTASVLSVIPANAIRAGCLVLIESGKLGTNTPAHETVGLLCFAAILLPLAWWISRMSRPPAPAIVAAPARMTHRILLLTAAITAPLMMARADSPTPPVASDPAPLLFTFNGVTLPLDPLPASPEEAAFAKSFPGTLSCHRWGSSHQIILRRVDVATRRLHPSRDCLRAAGFQTSDSVLVHTSDSCEWSMFHATRGETRLCVHERIVSERDDSSWTDVPAWFWGAVRHPLNGPWCAETVISQ